MSRERTVWIRMDREPRPGRADVAHVEIVHTDGHRAYLGEVSGDEDAQDAIHVGHLNSMDPWVWAARKGYSRPVSIQP
jgi:hypothetical protein